MFLFAPRLCDAAVGSVAGAVTCILLLSLDIWNVLRSEAVAPAADL